MFDPTYFSLKTFLEIGHDEDGKKDKISIKYEPIEHAFHPCNQTDEGRRPFALAPLREFEHELSNDYAICLNTSLVSFRNNFNYFDGY